MKNCKSARSGNKDKMNNKKVIILLVFLGALGAFYWFQIRPANLKQKELEEQVMALQDEVNNRPKSIYNSRDTDELKRDIEDLQYQIEDSVSETKRYLEDERNNQGNCERTGGRYQGNGFCVYH